MIVITTPTGTIGRQVLGDLLASDESLRVIARDPSRLPPAARERVEVVQGSHGDAAIVDRTFKGADAVFWLVPPERVFPCSNGGMAPMSVDVAAAMVVALGQVAAMVRRRLGL